MKTEVWLKIGAKRSYGNWKAAAVQAFKTKPSTNDKQIAVKIALEIPDEVFEEPVFEAEIKLPKITRKLPEKIEIGKSLGESLSAQLGFKVKVDMIEAGEET